MRLVQFATENKAYLAIAGGLTVFGLSLNDLAALLSVSISVMVLFEKFPAFSARVGVLMRSVWEKAKQVNHQLKHSEAPKVKLSSGWLLLALLSLMVFMLLMLTSPGV